MHLNLVLVFDVKCLRKSDGLDKLYVSILEELRVGSQKLRTRRSWLMFSLFGSHIFCTHPWLGAPNLVPADFLYSDVASFQYIAQGYRIYHEIFVQGGILRSSSSLLFRW